MNIALVEPQIPPNTGNIVRLCNCTGSILHIVGKPAFRMDDASLRRAGLDYWQNVELIQHKDWQSFIDQTEGNIWLFSKFGKRSYSDVTYTENDWLVFGSETSGLPESIHRWARENANPLLRIPVSEKCRSLNLANSVAVVLFEALRQKGFPDLQVQGPDYPGIES